MKPIKDIKAESLTVSVKDIPQFIELYCSDERTGVQTLLKTLDRKYNAWLSECQRLENILKYERKYYAKGIDLVAGIDEAGRGPLAGPVVAAAVILPKNCMLEGVNDSKKLSAKKREELYDVIMSNALSVSVGIRDHIYIDKYNILQATYAAMEDAVNGLSIKPQQLLVDAVTIPHTDIPQEGIIKGDALSISIGAASIIAKVTRDRLMLEYAKEYPDYDFEHNMGYGTAKHMSAIKQKGICPIHRLTFLKNAEI